MLEKNPKDFILIPSNFEQSPWLHSNFCLIPSLQVTGSENLDQSAESHQKDSKREVPLDCQVLFLDVEQEKLASSTRTQWVYPDRESWPPVLISHPQSVDLRTARTQLIPTAQEYFSNLKIYLKTSLYLCQVPEMLVEEFYGNLGNRFVDVGVVQEGLVQRQVVECCVSANAGRQPRDDVDQAVVLDLSSQ